MVRMPELDHNSEIDTTRLRGVEKEEKGIFGFLEMCVFCLLINVLGYMTTIALLLELKHE